MAPTTSPSTTSSSSVFNLGGSKLEADGLARSIHVQAPVITKWKRSSRAVKTPYMVCLISFCSASAAATVLNGSTCTVSIILLLLIAILVSLGLAPPLDLALLGLAQSSGTCGGNHDNDGDNDIEGGQRQSLPQPVLSLGHLLAALVQAAQCLLLVCPLPPDHDNDHHDHDNAVPSTHPELAQLLLFLVRSTLSYVLVWSDQNHDHPYNDDNKSFWQKHVLQPLQALELLQQQTATIISSGSRVAIVVIVVSIHV
ncbi:hypothetical protein ACA910_015758 [Epithemia clementina (nom. ined.)]